MTRFALALLAALPALAQSEVPLRAGLARVEITPAQFGPMYGYANRKCGPGAGVHDPLFAKALILQTGDMRVGIVTMDLGSLVSTRVRDEVKAKFGVQVLLQSASHSHSTPSFLPSFDGSTPASPYLQEVEDKVIAVVGEATKRMFPARLSAARGSLQLGYNRLLPRDNGRSRALFDNQDRVPYGPVDPEFMLLRVTDGSGAPKALVVHYGVHAVVLGPSNCKYSADYPGAMKARIEKEMPGVEAMFVQGAAGDVNPLFLARSGKEDDDFLVVKKMGETLAGEVLRAAKAMPPAEPNRDMIRAETESLEFPDRWDPAKKPVRLSIATVLLNRDMAIAAMPGEPLHRLQTEWKQRAEVAYPFFYGYTYTAGGEWPGYIPDLRSAAHGGYGADTSTRISIGAGETIVNRHLVHLYRLQGMWHDKPGQN
jgi:neutral ceramidase